MEAIRGKEVHPVWTKIQDPNRQRGAQPEREPCKRPKAKVLLASGRSSSKLRHAALDIKISGVTSFLIGF